MEKNFGDGNKSSLKEKTNAPTATGWEEGETKTMALVSAYGVLIFPFCAVILKLSTTFCPRHLPSLWRQQLGWELVGCHQKNHRRKKLLFHGSDCFPMSASVFKNILTHKDTKG